MIMSSLVCEKTYVIHLQNVLLVPKLGYSLVSLSQARKKGFKIIIDTNEVRHKTSQMYPVHKSINTVKLIGDETSKRLYEALVAVLGCEAATTQNMKKTNCDDTLGLCKDETITASLRHIDGVKQSEINDFGL